MNNRVALITGASRGIGAAIAHKLSSLNYTVLTPTREELDLLSSSSVDNYIKGLKSSVDVLINNAGINPLAGITEIDEKDFADTIQVNLTAPIKLIQGLVPSMKHRQYGRIVNISSIWGSLSKARRISYSSSKSGINGMTRAIAVELAEFNILVNAVAPGYVNTELTKQNNTNEEIQAISNNIPVRRLAEPSEIAEVVSFLVSEKNSYLTGQVIYVDGGFTCV
jgi:NAD(P)-dependent dehydrogenase (short-subunit alcohol dehydrogenase family)